MNDCFAMLCCFTLSCLNKAFIHSLLSLSDYATEPQAISKWLDGKASDGETQMGHGIQRLPGVRRWLHEHAGEQLFGISYNVKTISVLNLSPHLISNNK